MGTWRPRPRIAERAGGGQYGQTMAFKFYILYVDVWREDASRPSLMMYVWLKYRCVIDMTSEAVVVVALVVEVLIVVVVVFIVLILLVVVLLLLLVVLLLVRNSAKE